MEQGKKYDAKFKAKVALEAIKERETLNELAVKYEVSSVMISRWKKEFIDNSAAAFETPKVDDAAIERENNRYLRVIGDLQMQLNLPSVSFGVARQRQSELCFTISLLIILKQFEHMLRLLILKIFPPIGSNSHLPLALVFPLPLFCQVLGKVKRISRHVPEFHVLGEHLFIGIFFNPNFLFLLLKVKN